MKTLFDLSQPALPLGDALFPVRRIFCIGRNYADHAAEMGAAPPEEAPLVFTKSAHALLPPGDIPYPPGTEDLHHEVEMVLAIGAPLSQASAAEARAAITARAVGLDLTRRDLQARAKAQSGPWDIGKDFDGAAVIGRLSRAAAGPEIALSVNGQPRQQGRLDQMLFDEGALLVFLSSLWRLEPGDLVMTGTPAGVGPVQRGDRLRGRVDGLPELHARIV